MIFFFDRDTYCIPQPYGFFVYNIKNNKYDVYNNSAFDIILKLSQGLNIEEIILSLTRKFEDVKSEIIKQDIKRFLLDLEKKGYLTKKEKNPLNILYKDKKNILKMVRAEIEITKKCNLSCSYCYANQKNKSIDLSFEHWRGILNEIYKHGTRCVIISGGEPFLYEDFFELINYIDSKFIIEINSNGTLLDEENVKRLSKMNIKTIQISLDSSTPEIHDKYRGSGTWAKVIKSLKLLKRYNIQTRICMTVHSENCNDIENVKKISENFNAEFFPDSIKKVGRADKLENFLWDYQRKDFKRYTQHFAATFDVDCQSKIGFAAISNNGHLKPCNLSNEYFDNIDKEIIVNPESEWFYEWYGDIPSVKKFICSSKIREELEKNNYFHNCYLTS